MDYSVKIGGEAGQGIQTIGDTLARVCSRSGYHVFTHQDYESRIKGGHNLFQIRFSDAPVMASRAGIDILIALDKTTIPLHQGEMTENGRILYDSAAVGGAGDSPWPGLDIPFVKLAVEHGGNRIMANTVAIGAVMGLFGMDMEILNGIIRETFAKKGEVVQQANVKAARAGYDFAAQSCPRCPFPLAAQAPPRPLLAGIDALAVGALASGCRFYSAYPMTPSTGIMNYLAAHALDYGVIVEPAEDEIAAINMALGASFAGVRAMTGTSGGGFSLMVEGLSLAAMTETPVVIALGQRPGPATGLPTRTEQGELLFAQSAGHGEFTRLILAPGTPEQAIDLTCKAFDLAEKYQVPALILFDQYFADSEWTVENPDLAGRRYTDYRLRGEAWQQKPGYKRHAFTESGMSPLGIPGESTHLVVTDSDEHDEEGHIIEDAETRNRMVSKRLLRKLPLLRGEIGPPYRYGDERPDIVLVGWGSTYGVLKETIDLLWPDHKIAMLHFSEISPFPDPGKFDYLDFLTNAPYTLCVENNATGQFARLLKAETGYECKARINKYDGRIFTLEGLIGEIHAHISGL